MVESPPVASPPFRPTDSPWFWGLAFSAMALAGLAAIAPKFATRQTRLEARFAGREEAAGERARRAAGLEPLDLAEAAREPEAEPRRVVALWPLALVAAAAAAGSALMLAREARRCAAASHLGHATRPSGRSLHEASVAEPPARPPPARH